MVYIYSNSIKNKKIQILRSNFMSSNDKNFEYNDNFESVDEQKNIYSSSNHKVNKHSLINTKKLKNRKIMFSVAIALSVIVGLIGGALIYAYKMLDSLNYQPIESHDSEYVTGSTQDPMILNIALFGVDRHAEADSRSRSDSILILSIDSRHQKIKLTSLMRDMWVHIPGYKDNRINTAIALGGEPLAIKTIEHNFGIKIDRFCTVDFEGFKDIIDIIGGLDIEITAKEAHHINQLLVELDDALVKGGLTPFKSPLLKEVDGVHHLNGAQALQYARSRKVPTAEGFHDDYARTFRQRRVISLVMDKFKSSSLPQIISVIEKAGPYVNTNLKKNEIITLGKNSLKYLKYELTEFRLPQEGNFEGKNINGASVLVITDINKARYDLAKYIYEDSVKEDSYLESFKHKKIQNSQKNNHTNDNNSSSSNSNSVSQSSKNNTGTSSSSHASDKSKSTASQNSQTSTSKSSNSSSKSPSADTTKSTIKTNKAQNSSTNNSASKNTTSSVKSAANTNNQQERISSQNEKSSSIVKSEASSSKNQQKVKNKSN
jgi:LCP family protein required for cell wall assembly